MDGKFRKAFVLGASVKQVSNIVWPQLPLRFGVEQETNLVLWQLHQDSIQSCLFLHWSNKTNVGEKPKRKERISRQLVKLGTQILQN